MVKRTREEFFQAIRDAIAATPEGVVHVTIPVGIYDFSPYLEDGLGVDREIHIDGGGSIFWMNEEQLKVIRSAE